MKTKLILILFMAPLFGLSQQKGLFSMTDDEFQKQWSVEIENVKSYSTKLPTIFTYWKQYLTDCNTLVPDTIKQSGTVNVKYKPVIVNGEISHYILSPIDTVWNKVECKEYKINDDYGRFILGTGTPSWIDDNNIIYTSTGMAYTSIEQINNKINISRNKICHIKKRKASWDDFWNRWLVEKKIIEMN